MSRPCSGAVIGSACAQPVIVADRDFARASLFRWFLGQQRQFVIRFDPETHPEKRWLTWLLSILFFLVLVFPALGLLVGQPS